MEPVPTLNSSSLSIIKLFWPLSPIIIIKAANTVDKQAPLHQHLKNTM